LSGLVLVIDQSFPYSYDNNKGAIMCVGCAAAYAAIAASTVTYSLSDISGKESAFNFTINSEEWAKAAAINTSATGTASIVIKNETTAAAKSLRRGIDRGSLRAE
jgi:hypothetical protein